MAYIDRLEREVLAAEPAPAFVDPCAPLAPDSWECMCGCYNYARRDHCTNCRQPRYQSWVCDCGTPTVGAIDSCPKCKAARPAAAEQAGDEKLLRAGKGRVPERPGLKQTRQPAETGNTSAAEPAIEDKLAEIANRPMTPAEASEQYRLGYNVGFDTATAGERNAFTNAPVAEACSPKPDDVEPAKEKP